MPPTSNNNSDAIISLIDVVKTYQRGTAPVNALRGVNLDVKKGEFLALMGPSGSGKSTLMNLLGLLDRLDSGKYKLMNVEVGSLNDDERSHIRCQTIGFIFQSFNLLSRSTALRNVMLPLAYSKFAIDKRPTLAREALEAVGLKDRIDHYPNQLSGGECQRVAIARALVNDPAVILADEPTGNLDSKTGNEIMNILTNLSKQGRTLIMVTHDPIVAQRADRIVRMFDGKIT